MKLYSEEFTNNFDGKSKLQIVQSLLAATLIVAALLGPIGMMAAKVVG